MALVAKILEIADDSALISYRDDGWESLEHWRFSELRAHGGRIGDVFDGSLGWFDRFLRARLEEREAGDPGYRKHRGMADVVVADKVKGREARREIRP